MSEHKTTQPYSTLGELVLSERILLPAPKETWRLVKEPPSGEINGLVRFRGVAIATNGIIVLIRRGDNTIVFGHLQWFVKDNDEPSDLDDDIDKVSAKRRQPQRDKILEDLVASYL